MTKESQAERLGSSQVVLILAPTANDASLAVDTLKSAGVLGVACANADELCKNIISGCGTVILSEEALTPETIRCFQEALEKQGTWSDLPIILLTNAGVESATEFFSTSGNISLLERPFSRLTLIRSVEVALRARLKQYEVRDLVLALKRSKDDAERANLAKTQFLANMSHEIRTPIGAIMGFIDLIKNSNSDPSENLNYMAIIDRNSQQLLRLIDDILDLTKVEAGKMTIENINFRFNDFLTDFIADMNFKAVQKGLQFRTMFETEIPDQITSDPMRLRQILANVVGNAIKFTDKGFVELTISYHEPALKFVIRDTGIGLNMEQALKLFQPFAQADSSTTRKFGGTGLGLVLSRRLSEALGGNLDLISSSPGNGSTFGVEVRPVLSPQMKMIDQNTGFSLQPSAHNSLDESQVLKRLKVLLVEDSPDNQMLISTYLRKTGARIDVRSNGVEGVEAALKENYDLILMDIQMPVMDGHEATQKLRKMYYSKPIIALTAHAMTEEKVKCFASGFTDYLTKPVQRNILIDVLSRYKLKAEGYQNPAFLH